MVCDFFSLPYLFATDQFNKTEPLGLQVRLYQIFDTDRAAYLVMELCTGGRLREYITRHAVDVGCGLAEDEVRRLFTQLTDAVAYCHTNGMAHRLVTGDFFYT